MKLSPPLTGHFISKLLRYILYNNQHHETLLNLCSSVYDKMEHALRVTHWIFHFQVLKEGM